MNIAKKFNYIFFVLLLSINYLFANSDYNIFYLSEAGNEIILPEPLVIKAKELIKNIKLFESELNLNSGTNVDYIFDEKFNEKKEFECKIIKRSDRSKIIKLYKIKDIYFDEINSLLLSVNFEINNSSNEGNNVIYKIYNIKFDDKNNIAERIITEHNIDKTLISEKDELKFKEGKLILYNQYSPNLQPASFVLKTFLLKLDGSFQWIKTKESLNRTFNENGQITSESIRETSFSYKDEPLFYNIYNLSFHEKGEVENFDVIFNESKDLDIINNLNNKNIEDKNIDIPSNFNFKNIEDKNNKNFSKLIRKFKITEGKKIFKTGEIETNSYDEANKIAVFNKLTFVVKPETEGIEETERIRSSSYFEFINLNTSKQIIKKRIIQSSFINEGESHILSSLIDINFSYDDSKKLNKIIICFPGYKMIEKSEVILNVQKIIDIDFLETMENGEPSKIKLTITSKNEEDPYTLEEIIEQDCHYIISQALTGTLFFENYISVINFSINIDDIDQFGELKLTASEVL